MLRGARTATVQQQGGAPRAELAQPAIASPTHAYDTGRRLHSQHLAEVSLSHESLSCMCVSHSCQSRSWCHAKGGRF